MQTKPKLMVSLWNMKLYVANMHMIANIIRSDGNTLAEK